MQEKPIWLLFSVILLPWILCPADAKGTYYQPPPPGRFIHNLYTSGYHSQQYGKPISKHRNYCVYVVQKNVTCTQQDGMESYVKAEYLKCSWGPKCPGTVVYRTLFRPKYKIGYKVVTELQWKCCPGHSGESCQDGSMPPSGFVPPYGGPKSGPVQNMFPAPKSPPTHPNLQPETLPDIPPPGKKSGYGRKLAPMFGERLDRVEEEVRRLSQSYDSLQGTLSSLGDSLRLSIQEDTSKMIGSLVSAPSSSSQASVGFGVIPDAVAEASQVTGDLSGRVAEVSDILRSKTELLEEVNGMVMGHEAQIQHLLEATRPSPLTSTELLEQYLESKLAESRAQLLEGLEARFQKLQGACDTRVQEVQKECLEGGQATGQRLQHEMDGREVEMRREMSELGARVQGLSAPEGCCGRMEDLTRRVEELERGMLQLREEHHSLSQKLDMELVHLTLDPLVSARLEEVEGRLNLTEEGNRRCCQEGMERGQLPSELDGIRASVDDKVRVLEERLLTAIGELSNTTAPLALDGATIEAQMSVLQREGMESLTGLDGRLAAVEELCAAGCSVPGGESLLEIHNGLSQCLEQNKDLHTRLGNLNNTVLGIQRKMHSQEEEGLHGEITLLQVNLRGVGRSLHGLEETVSKYADTVIQVNSTAEERGSRLNDELISVQGLVNGQASQIRSSRGQLLGLRGDMERMKARLAGQLGTCQHIARELHGEVAQFERRMSEIEGACRGPENGVLGYFDQLNNTLASHEQGLAALRQELSKINQLAPSLAEPPTTQDNYGGK
ncbi:EMILIN-3 [Discoglossus pictus]